MRTIKFRAWDKLGKIMIYDYCYLSGVNFAAYDLTNNTHYIESVMQYTGLKDKNDKEIYEGDIILLKNILESLIPERLKDYNAVVYWCKRGALFRYNIAEVEQTFPMEHTGEVIGNIHENPELLS